jgi:hypothetical protein
MTLNPTPGLDIRGMIGIKGVGRNISDVVKIKQVVATLAATVEKNQRLIIRELASILDMTFATVQYTVTVELGRVNKSAHCCPVPEKRKESSAVRASFSSFARVPW